MLWSRITTKQIKFPRFVFQSHNLFFNFYPQPPEVELWVFPPSISSFTLLIEQRWPLCSWGGGFGGDCGSSAEYVLLLHKWCHSIMGWGSQPKYDTGWHGGGWGSTKSDWVSDSLHNVGGHSSTNGVLKSRYQKMNIFVYILGRIPPTSFVSSARWSPILQAGWPWCHSIQMVCIEYTVCVECTVCLLWKKLHRIKLHKYYKKTSWTDLESLDLVYTF